LKRHMNRKKPCLKSIRKENHSESQMNHSESQIVPVESKSIVFTCQYCSKTFSTNSNMNRHLRLYCKEHKLVQENARLYKEIQILQNQITTTTVNTTNNTINNNQKIIINAYGSENLEHLLPTLPTLIKHFPATAVTDLICERYYDPDHPENKSVKIRSTKEKWAQIYNGQKWEMQKKMDVVMDVLQKSFEFIDEFYETNDIENPEYRQNKITWDNIRNMWNSDSYPDKKMLDTTEEILTNQNQTNSDYRKCIK